MTRALILIDHVPLDEFIARYGQPEAERRIALSLGEVVGHKVEVEIDARSIVHIGKRAE